MDETLAGKSYNMIYRSDSENTTLYYYFSYKFQGKTLEEVKKEIGL
jgi:hypothetical protein